MIKRLRGIHELRDEAGGVLLLRTVVFFALVALEVSALERIANGVKYLLEISTGTNSPKGAVDWWP